MSPYEKQVRSTLAQNTRLFRKKKGLMLAGLEAISGVPKSVISGIENEKQNPSLSTLCALARGLNREVVELLGEFRA